MSSTSGQVLKITIAAGLVLAFFYFSNRRQRDRNANARQSNTDDVATSSESDSGATALAGRTNPLKRTSYSVTIVVNEVIITERNGRLRLVESSFETVKYWRSLKGGSLSKNSPLDIYFVAIVSGREEEEKIRNLLESSFIEDKLIDRRRILFCEQKDSVRHIVRHISPDIHIGTDLDVVKALCPFITLLFWVNRKQSKPHEERVISEFLRRRIKKNEEKREEEEKLKNKEQLNEIKNEIIPETDVAVDEAAGTSGEASMHTTENKEVQKTKNFGSSLPSLTPSVTPTPSILPSVISSSPTTTNTAKDQEFDCIQVGDNALISVDDNVVLLKSTPSVETAKNTTVPSPSTSKSKEESFDCIHVGGNTLVSVDENVVVLKSSSATKSPDATVGTKSKPEPELSLSSSPSTSPSLSPTSTTTSASVALSTFDKEKEMHSILVGGNASISTDDNIVILNKSSAEENQMPEPTEQFVSASDNSHVDETSEMGTPSYKDVVEDQNIDGTMVDKSCFKSEKVSANDNGYIGEDDDYGVDKCRVDHLSEIMNTPKETPNEASEESNSTDCSDDDSHDDDEEEELPKVNLEHLRNVFESNSLLDTLVGLLVSETISSST